MNMEKYVVRLSEEERLELKTIVKKLKGTSQKVNRAIALLHADADGPNWTNEKIRDLTDLSIQSIVNIRKRLVTEGFEVALHRKKLLCPPVPKKLDGMQEARIIATRCDTPSKTRYGNTVESGRRGFGPIGPSSWRSRNPSLARRFGKH